MGAGEAQDELSQGAGDIFHEGLRQPPGRGGAQGVPVQPGVRRRDEALLAGDPDPHRAPLALELAEHGAGVQPGQHALGGLGHGEVAEAAEQVRDLVAIGGARQLRASLEVVFDLSQGAWIDELAQLLLAEQLAQQLAVERQGCGPPLGVRRVALVHIGGDVVEEQRRGEGRGGRGLHFHERHLALVNRA